MRTTSYVKKSRPTVMDGYTRSGYGFIFRRNQHEFKEVKTNIL